MTLNMEETSPCIKTNKKNKKSDIMIESATFRLGHLEGPDEQSLASNKSHLTCRKCPPLGHV